MKTPTLLLLGLMSWVLTVSAQPAVTNGNTTDMTTIGCEVNDQCTCKIEGGWTQMSQYAEIKSAKIRIDKLEKNIGHLDYSYIVNKMTNITVFLESLERSIDTQAVDVTMRELIEVRKAVDILAQLVAEIHRNGTNTQQTAAMKIELQDLSGLLDDLWGRNPYGSNDDLHQELDALRDKLRGCQDQFGSFTTSYFPGDTMPAPMAIDTDYCLTHTVDSIGDSFTHRWVTSPWGNWFKDPYPRSDVNRSEVYYRDSTYNGYYRYRNYTDFASNTRPEKFNVVHTHGTGYIVYNSTVYTYYNYRIYMYNLRNGATTNLPFNKGVSLYQGPTNLITYVDLKADEYGLWALYATPQNQGKLEISLLNPETLQEIKIFRTNRHKKSVCAAFMACGRLYTIDTCDRRLTPAEHVTQYMYDTHTRTESFITLHLTSKYGQIYQVNYNPREKMLFGWDKGHMVTYTVNFKSPDVPVP